MIDGAGKPTRKGAPPVPSIPVPETSALPIVDAQEPSRPVDKPKVGATPEEKRSLLDLRAFNTQAEGKFTYNAGGNIIIDPNDGSVSFSDLTMELVPLAQMLCANEAQKRRLGELRADWPGGADPLQAPASYVKLVESGEIDRRIALMKEIRERDRFGIFARAGAKGLKLGGYNLNVGEERPISGNQGSGTVYFSHCSMKCSFCQYADISQMKGGVGQKPKDLAAMMLELQDRGAHNIQLMTPSHYAVEILEAVKQAAKQGLRIPLVWNSGGMEDLDAIRALEGIVDVYLPDLKFGNDAAGKRYGRVDGYVENTIAAIQEMHRQVGALEVDERGVAIKGVLVRHLVMPSNAAESELAAKALAGISRDLPISLLRGWVPSHLTFQTPEINRKVTEEEHQAARRGFEGEGFRIVSEPWESAAKTPNTEPERAWKIREALRRRIEAVPEASRSESLRALASIIAGLDGGRIEPDRANHVLLALAGDRSPEAAASHLASQSEVSPPLLALSGGHASVDAATARDAIDGPIRAGTAKRKAAFAKTPVLGSAISSALLSAAPGLKVAAFFDRLEFVPPLVLDALAELNGAASAAAFLREVEHAPPAELDAAVSWLNGAGNDWRRLSDAMAFSATKRGSDPVRALRAIAKNPDASSRSKERRERLALGLAEAFGLDVESMRLQLRAREREAANGLAKLAGRVGAALGEGRTAVLLSRLDLAAEVASIADLRDGARITTDLESPELLRRKLDALASRIAEEIGREAGDALRARLSEDPRFKELAPLLAKHPAKSAHARVALADVVLRASGVALDHSAIEVAAGLTRADSIDRALDALAAELKSDPNGFTADLQAHLEQLTFLERGVRADRSARKQLNAELARGLLRMPSAVVREIEQAMESAHPNEGLGYLIGDGSGMLFVPVRNALDQTELGSSNGIDDRRDLTKMAELIERTGMQLIAKVHSHPEDDPRFSERDLDSMRKVVAFLPGTRTVIDGVRRTEAGFVHRLASFSSGVAGQVLGEDRIEVA